LRRTAADGEIMESLISLEYPNGRTHQATFTSPSALQPGGEFVLYGRRWRAIGHVPERRLSPEPSRLLCRSTSRDLEPAPDLSS
jgi:hypothetical protein